MTTPPEIASDRCSCRPDACAHFVEPPSACISRLDGEVVTRNCPKCIPDGHGTTWHHNGRCLRCATAASLPVTHPSAALN
jgi:hypothetical protein